MADVNVLDLLSFEARAFYVMDRGYLDFTRLHRLHQAGAFFVTRAKRGFDARHVYSNAVDRSTGLICNQLVLLTGYYPVRNCPEHLRRIEFKDPLVRPNIGVLDHPHRAAGADDLRALQEPLASRVVLQIDQAAFAN
jgi:hypothetical protein